VTSDFDLPVIPNPDQIRVREFATVRRGYDPDQVRDYLNVIADHVQQMDRDLRSRKPAEPMSAGEHLAARLAAEEEAKAARQKQPFGDPYADLGKRFASVIETADREAAKVVEEAKEEANRILTAARTEADRIRVDAQARAEEARHEASEQLVRAREEADRIIGGLSGRREALITQMQEMQTRLLGVAKELETAVADRDEIIDKAMEARAERPSAFQRPTEQEPGAKKPDPVDPRYEDLWVSKEAKESKDDSVDIPDLAPIDLDFDDDTRAD
jgi:DivIVA domain-containing protein